MKDASHVKTNKQRSQFGSSKYKKTTFQKCSRKISIKQKKKRWLLDLGFFSPLRNIREMFSFEVWDGIRKRGSRFLGIEIHCLPVTSA